MRRNSHIFLWRNIFITGSVKIVEKTSKILKIIVITFIILFCSIQCAFADDVDEEIVEVNQEFTENCINEVAKISLVNQQ